MAANYTLQTYLDPTKLQDVLIEQGYDCALVDNLPLLAFDVCAETLTRH